MDDTLKTTTIALNITLFLVNDPSGNFNYDLSFDMVSKIFLTLRKYHISVSKGFSLSII